MKLFLLVILLGSLFLGGEAHAAEAYEASAPDQHPGGPKGGMEPLPEKKIAVTSLGIERGSWFAPHQEAGALLLGEAEGSSIHALAEDAGGASVPDCALTHPRIPRIALALAPALDYSLSA